jgi:hypothetical protein
VIEVTEPNNAYLVAMQRRMFERKGLVCQVHESGHPDRPVGECIWKHESVLCDA